MKKIQVVKKYIWFILLGMAMALWSCSGPSTASNAEHDEHEGEGQHKESTETGHEGEIIFTKKQAALTDFALYKVVPADFREVIATSGRILSAQGDEATATAPVSGIVSFAHARLTDGAAVGKGQTLFTISSKGLSEGDYAMRVKADYEQAKSVFDRAKSLIDEQIITRSEYEQRQRDYEQSRAAYSALADKQSAAGTRVVAPIGGFIKSVVAREGTYVQEGEPLAVVSQNRRLELRAEVSQRYASALQTVTSAHFRTPYDNRLYALDRMNGRLVSVGRAAEESSVYIPVTFEFDNGGNVISGSFVEVFLLATPQKDAMVVPVSAISEEQGSYYVYVQNDEEGYFKRQVTLGANDGERVRVLSGLKFGETVVSHGVTQVRMAAFSGAIPEGHSHSH